MNIMYVLAEDIRRNTSANIRNSSLVKGLLQLNNQVQVVCLQPVDSPDKRIEETIEGSDLTFIMSEPRLSAAFTKKNNGIRSKLKKVFVKLYNVFRIYDPNAYKIKRVVINPNNLFVPDLIISSSDPRSSHLLALKIIKAINYNGRYVQYWGDPMTNDIAASLIVRPLLKRAEKDLLKKANAVFYTNDATCESISNMHHISKTKLFSLPTACETKITQIYNEQSKDKLVLGYFGEYYSFKRNISPLIDSVVSNENYSLIIAGTTDISIPLSNRITQYPFISSEKVEQLQKKVHILIVLENKPKSGRSRECLQIPGKVFHYGVTNKKVLVISETGLTEKAFSKYKRYAFCPNNKDAISNAIKDLHQQQDESFFTPVVSFSPLNVAKQLIQIIETI